jgi:hypothetical protein
MAERDDASTFAFPDGLLARTNSDQVWREFGDVGLQLRGSLS